MMAYRCGLMLTAPGGAWQSGRCMSRLLVPLSKDVKVYELMALIDALRVGGARERSLAADLITKKLAGK